MQATAAAHVRLAILRFLEDAPRYTSNSSMLAALLPEVGFHLTRDQVAGHLQWLSEQGMVDLDESRRGFAIVTATAHGADLARGAARHPGVARPGA